MILPVLAIAGTSFVTAVLGLRVVALPHVPFEVGLVVSLGIAFCCGLHRPTIMTVAGAGPATVVGLAAAWSFVLAVDPRSPGENILMWWLLFGVVTAGAAAVGRLVASLRMRDQKAPGHL